MRGGEYTKLAAPRSLCVTVGGTRARVLARARVPQGGGRVRPRNIQTQPPPSLVPPRPNSHPNLWVKKGLFIWWGGSGVSQEGRLPSRPKWGAGASGQRAYAPSPVTPAPLLLLLLPLPALLWRGGKGGQDYARTIPRVLLRFLDSSPSGSTSMSEPAGDRSTPQNRPEVPALMPSRSAPESPFFLSPRVPSAGSRGEGAEASPSGGLSPPDGAAPPPTLPPRLFPLRDQVGGGGAVSTRNAPGGTGRHLEGSPGL